MRCIICILYVMCFLISFVRPVSRCEESTKNNSRPLVFGVWAAAAYFYQTALFAVHGAGRESCVNGTILLHLVVRVYTWIYTFFLYLCLSWPLRYDLMTLIHSLIPHLSGVESVDLRNHSVINTSCHDLCHCPVQSQLATAHILTWPPPVRPKNPPNQVDHFVCHSPKLIIRGKQRVVSWVFGVGLDAGCWDL